MYHVECINFVCETWLEVIRNGVKKLLEISQALPFGTLQVYIENFG